MEDDGKSNRIIASVLLFVSILSKLFTKTAANVAFLIIRLRPSFFASFWEVFAAFQL